MADVLSATKQFKRLFNGTLDPSMSWDTLEELQEYLKDPTCPKNMVVGAAGRAYITYINSEGNMALSELGAIDNLDSYKLEVDEKLRQLEILINESNYKEITTSKYTIYPTNAEMGSTVDVTVNWEYNKDIVTYQKLNSIDLDINVRTYSFTNIKSNTTFKLEFSDGTTSTSKSITLSFLNSRCYGVSDSKNYNSDLIKSLSKALTGSRACSFTVNSGNGQYIYYCIPTRFGTPSFSVGGFEGGFSLVNTLDYTNPSGYTESYNIYRSDYSNLGNTTVVVK